VYGSRPAQEVSWYQSHPATSLRLVREAEPDLGASILDVGGGTSLLVDRLLDAGYVDLTVLDISQTAVSEVARRLGDRARHVSLVCTDVLGWNPTRRYDLWHDRAVFHFLVTAQDRSTYVALASETIPIGGSLVLGVFAEDGPTHCSGLPTERYSPEALASAFSEAFSLVHAERELHVTPRGGDQPFTWVVLRRV
jgi:predicted TPR repeat methyltransferase